MFDSHVRFWWSEIQQTPTVWSPPSLLHLSPKRTFPAWPAWTTTEPALRCIHAHGCTWAALCSFSQKWQLPFIAADTKILPLFCCSNLKWSSFYFKNGNLKNFITAGNSWCSALVKRTEDKLHWRLHPALFCRWRYVAVSPLTKWRTSSSGGTTPPPNTLTFTMPRWTFMALRQACTMLWRTRRGSEETSSLWALTTSPEH